MGYNDEDDFLMISEIQHFQFCKRQWALIHIEQQWEENVRTVEGQHLHQKADQPFVREKRGDKLVVRAMAVQSRELGLSGRCDVVEFLRDEERGVPIHGADGRHLPVPVEYKRGKPKRGAEDVLQLAAQAVCLEEMLLCEVGRGELYYHEIRQRVPVPLTAVLKAQVKETVLEMQEHRRRNHTPKVKTGPHCRSCSLQHRCLPGMLGKRSVGSYIAAKLGEEGKAGEEGEVGE
ncbi:CRISPR-associated protein Cas4 [Paenibacillus sp. IB182496]|uniref:CRISPR-associated exonuclease Cas4 n=1 Tax=Paenibacillus sabuli TaxID=2772509 RepID=A0A927BWH8_9BACL|nr:CRISPR-associated protein Cas4 [Paenibacillus sabuli]MBD2848156.1 CRISPR-associated protein Cas4 [Paenibacillus sabuli]